MFLSHCDNALMIDEPWRKEGLKHLRLLQALWEQFQKEGILKPVSPYLLFAFSIYPIFFLLEKPGHFGLTSAPIHDANEMA